MGDPLDAGERVVAAFSPRLSKKVADSLADLGVTVLEGARVTDIDERGVTYEADGESKRIDARTVVWAAGVHPVALVDALARATGAETDRSGRIKAGPTSRFPVIPRSRAATLPASTGPAASRSPASPRWPSSRRITWRRASMRAGSGHRRRSSIWTRGPWRSWAEDGRYVRSGDSDSRAGPRSSPTPGVHLFYLGGQMGRRLEVMFNGWEPASVSARAR